MAGSLISKGNIVLHAIAITTTIAVFVGRPPLNSLFQFPPNLHTSWHHNQSGSNPWRQQSDGEA